nr:hypothetical protein [Tanacetum cinerariifolium]
HPYTAQPSSRSTNLPSPTEANITPRHLSTSRLITSASKPPPQPPPTWLHHLRTTTLKHHHYDNYIHINHRHSRYHRDEKWGFCYCSQQLRVFGLAVCCKKGAFGG